MSTNKTENYGLHAWEPEDDFLRSEFNENFEKLDEAVRIVTGRYVGNDDAVRVIELGFTPRAVLVFNSLGQCCYDTRCFGGLAISDSGVRTMGYPALEIVEGGFQAHYKSGLNNNWSIRVNERGYGYHYLAIR